MPKKILILAGKVPTEKPIEFSLEEEDGEINILMNGSVIAYFEPTEDGRVKLTAAGLSGAEKSLLVTDKNGLLSIS